jgi:hypothetical protein
MSTGWTRAHIKINPHGLDMNHIDYNRASHLQNLLGYHNRMQQDAEIEELCMAGGRIEVPRLAKHFDTRAAEKPPERLSQDNANAVSLQGLRPWDSLNCATLETLPDDEAPSRQDPLRPPIVAKARPKPPVKSRNRSRTPLPVPPNFRKPWLDTSASSSEQQLKEAYHDDLRRRGRKTVDYQKKHDEKTVGKKHDETTVGDNCTWGSWDEWWWKDESWWTGKDTTGNDTVQDTKDTKDGKPDHRSKPEPSVAASPGEATDVDNWWRATNWWQH